MDLIEFQKAFGNHPELDDLPDFDRAKDFERRERLVAANAAWLGAKPGGLDERSFNAVLRIGRRLRKWLRIG